MTVAAELERLKSYPDRASEEFRCQLEMLKKVGEQQLSSDALPQTGGRGIDRSRELSPIARPTIVRTLLGA